MNIINLTPHAITFIKPNGEKMEVPASGNLARVAVRTENVGEIDGISVTTSVFGEVEGITRSEGRRCIRRVIACCRKSP